MKSEIKLRYLNNQYQALEALGAKDGRKAFRSLRRLEVRAHRLAEAMCHMYIEECIIEEIHVTIETSVRKIFGGKLPNGFFINSDPRGYALKIDYAVVTTGLHTDFGGYGILAPNFKG